LSGPPAGAINRETRTSGLCAQSPGLGGRRGAGQLRGWAEPSVLV